MRRKIKELKRIARGNLAGNYMILIRVFMLYQIITSLVEFPFSMMTTEVLLSTQNIIYFIATILIDIAAVVLIGGQYRIHLSIARKGKIHLSDLFYPLKYHADRYIFTELLLFGLTFISMIPLAVGVILFYTQKSLTFYFVSFILLLVSLILKTYLSLTFDLVYFILNDNEELGMIKALKYTRELVMTHRKRYLYLTLSFFPMLLLVLLSFGIAIFWVHPYMVQTTTLFYLDVKGELDEVIENRQKNGPSPEPVIFNQYV